MTMHAAVQAALSIYTKQGILTRTNIRLGL